MIMTPALFRSSSLPELGSMPSRPKMHSAGDFPIQMAGRWIWLLAERTIKPVFKADGLNWKGWHA
jgi:hypothetical protein